LNESGKFTPKYSIPRDVNPIVKELRDLAKRAKEIYIATMRIERVKRLDIKLR